MASSLLLDDHFESQDSRFVEILRSCDDDGRLAHLADRILKDGRSWVREQVLKYLDTPFDRPGHHPLVKRLFKHAESQGDAEAMALFLVGFDRSIRRKMVRYQQYDWKTRTSREIENLLLPRLGLLAKHKAKHPEAVRVRFSRQRPGLMLFSLATRLHLRRRSWRFFRFLGFQKPEKYIASITPALLRYTDTDLSAGYDLLESWGLVHALFGDSPVLSIKGTWIGVTEGKNLADLEAAPAFSALWKAPEAIPHLLNLVVNAKSKLVRTWAQDWMRSHHPEALYSLSLVELRHLLDADWEDVRLLGLDLFGKHPKVPTLTVREWIDFLSISDPVVLAQIAAAMQVHVRGSRLNHEDSVTLACHRSVPVVRMALTFMAEKNWDSEAEINCLLGLRRTSCSALAREIGKFLLDRLATPERYKIENIFIALDHRLEGMRSVAMEWIVANRHLRQDPLLWVRAAETPYDEVRCWLLRSLEKFAEDAKVTGDQQSLLWTTVLLGVHRGGREKQAAIRQLTQAIISSEKKPDDLLPLLAAALRSLRLPERRTACAGIVTILVHRPELAQQITMLFPELDFSQVVQEVG